MWEYKIVRSNLGWQIYKKQEKNGFIQIWFLYPHDKRGLNKDFARTFYHREDALSALVIIKTKDGKEDTD